MKTLVAYFMFKIKGEIRKRDYTEQNIEVVQDFLNQPFLEDYFLGSKKKDESLTNANNESKVNIKIEDKSQDKGMPAYGEELG